MKRSPMVPVRTPEEAEELLAREETRLVIHRLVNRFLGPLEPWCRRNRLEDYLSAAWVAAVRAAWTWQPGRGRQWTSYLWLAARHALQAETREGVIRVGSAGTPHASVGRIREAIYRARGCVSLDSGGPSGTLTAEDVGGLALAVEDELPGEVGFEEVHAALRQVPARYRQVLTRHFLHGVSRKEIAGEMGVSKERIRQLLEAGFAAFRKAYLGQERP